MKKWFPVFALVILVVVGIFLFQDKDKKEVAEKGEKIVVTLNGGPKETELEEIKRLKSEIAKFNEIYPNIEIRWTGRPYTPDSFSTSMAGGTAEDVIGLWATEGYVIERGYALDITKFVDKWEHKKDLNTALLSPFMRDEKVYALPYNGYVMALAYNKKLFKEAGLVDGNGKDKVPTNWEEFIDCAQKLTNRQKGVSGFGIWGKDASAGWGLLNWIWQAGGDFEQNIDGKWKAVFGEQGAVEGLQFVKDMRWKYDVLQPNILITWDQTLPLFAAGQLGMMFVAFDWVPQLINKFGMDRDDIGIAMLPAGPAGRANQMGGYYYIINPKSSPEVQEAAFKWISWYILPDPQRVKNKGEDLRKQNIVGAMSALPIFIGELDEKYRAAAGPYSDVLLDFPDVWTEATKYIRTEPPFFSQQLYSEYLGPAVQAVLTQKNANPKSLLQKAAKGFQERFLNSVGK